MQVSITKYIIKKLQQALGIIQDTDTASQAIAKGKFVFWKGTLKKAKSAISSGDTLSSSNLDDVSGGALNNEMGEANSMYAGTPGIVPTPPAGNSVLTNHGWQSFISSVPSFKIPILGGDSDYTTCSTRAIGTKFDELSEHIGNLSSLSTTAKTDTVSAINEVVGRLGFLNITKINNQGMDIKTMNIGWSSTLGNHLVITTTNNTKYYIKCD